MFPKSDDHSAPMDKHTGLQAINGTTIPTYGKKLVKVRFNKKTFEHSMTVARIDQAIIGWDMLMKFRFDLLWSNSQCILFSQQTKSSYPLQLGRAEKGNLGLATVQLSGAVQIPAGMHTTFKKYSQAQKLPQPLRPIPPAYQQLLDRYPEVMECKFLDNPLHGVIHQIDTKNHPPCKAKMRPLLKGSPKEVIGKRNWFELEKLGVVERIKPGQSTTWSSALHLAPKDGDDLRVCSDFRPLNDLTALDLYPLPSLRAFSSQLQGCKVFSKVDLRRAFFQVPLDFESSLKTVTLTPWGAFRYKRLAMGLRNAPQSFQKLMDHILAGMSGVFCYMDDIMCFSDSEETHLTIVEDRV